MHGKASMRSGPRAPVHASSGRATRLPSQREQRGDFPHEEFILLNTNDAYKKHWKLSVQFFLYDFCEDCCIIIGNLRELKFG
jgi:hypothetical protein